MLTIPATSTTSATSGTPSVTAEYQPPVKKAVLPAKTAAVPDKAPYHVILSAAARAKSMKLEGYSLSTISLKLGLDIKTVSQFLGIATSTTTTAYKTTYTAPKAVTVSIPTKSTYTAPKSMTFSIAPKAAYIAPKSTYTAPKAAYEEPKATTQSREQLVSALQQHGLETLQPQPGDENTHLVVPLQIL